MEAINEKARIEFTWINDEKESTWLCDCYYCDVPNLIASYMVRMKEGCVKSIKIVPYHG